MVMSNVLNDRERDKFKQGSNGETLVQTTIVDSGSLLQGISFDYIAITYPTSTTEVYTYKTGGSGGTTVATVTTTYSSSAKKEIISVART